MKDLSSDLYGSDNCGKTLVKENNILKATHALRTTLCPEGERIQQRYGQRQRRLEQLYHSRPISKLDSYEQERTKKISIPS